MTLRILFVLFIASQAHATWPAIMKNWLAPKDAIVIPTFDPKPLLLEQGIISAHQYVLDKKQFDLLNAVAKKRISTLSKMLIEFTGKASLSEIGLAGLRKLDHDVQKYVEDSQKLRDILAEQHRIQSELIPLLLEKRCLSKLKYYAGPRLEEIPEIKAFLDEASGE